MVRGKQPIRVECAPAFNYALAEHRTSLVPDDTIPENGENASDKQKKALFESNDLTLDLRFVAESVIDGVPSPSVQLRTLDLTAQGHKGISVSVDLDLTEGQVVTFVLRTPPKATREHNPDPTKEQSQQPGISFDSHVKFVHTSELLGGIKKGDPLLTKVSVTLFGLPHVLLTNPKTLLRDLLQSTTDFWNAWIRKSTYDGSWKEAVHRSALALKLLIYEPTGSFILVLNLDDNHSTSC